MKIVSPLRYPGGKAKFFRRFAELIQDNALHGVIYREPYAGGAGLAVSLLTLGYVSEIHLNDIDSGIAAFWHYALFDTENFCRRIASVPLTVREWRRQRDIYLNGEAANSFERAFAAFYLNRTSRSGIIIGAGPIGGYEQKSRWGIDARFNRSALVGNLQLLSRFSPKIRLSQLDAIEFIRQTAKGELLYADPPYYRQGNRLYRNFYSHDDHVAVAAEIRSSASDKWVVSYDSAPEILEIYAAEEPTFVDIQYSVANVRTAKEVLFVGPGLQKPICWNSLNVLMSEAA
jgi:DNA adenine methylase